MPSLDVQLYTGEASPNDVRLRSLAITLAAAASCICSTYAIDLTTALNGTNNRVFPGGVGTDILTSQANLQFAQLTSYFIRFNVVSWSGTNTERLFAWGDNTTDNTAIFNTLSKLRFVADLGIFATPGSWEFTYPTTGVEHDLLITFDAGSLANVPVVYLDGVSVTVTPFSTPTGTPVFTNSKKVNVGNRADLTRCFNGSISTFAIWKGVLLGLQDAKMLHSGTGPQSFQPGSLALHYPLDKGEGTEPDIDAANNAVVSGTTIGTAPAYLYDRRGLRLMVTSATGCCSTVAGLTTAITMLAACSGVCATNLPALSTQITMAASATCICSTSAALTTAITMASASSCVCATNLPVLTTAITMAAAAFCLCSTSAALTTQITMAASATGVCSTSASLTTAITMLAACSGVCSTSCGMTTAIRCLASATGVCSTSASLTTQITMASAASGVCSTACGLTTAIRCLGAATGICSTSASLTTAITCLSAASGICSTASSLSTAITLLAGCAGVCSTSAALTTAIRCLASATGVCSTSAGLVAGTGMFGTSSCLCSTTAALSTAITCLSVSSGICSTTANVTTAIRLSSAASGLCSATAALSAGLGTLVAGSATGICSTTSALSVLFRPQIIIVSASRAYTVLATPRPETVEANERDYVVLAGGPNG